MSNRETMQQALECIERLNMRGFILADFETEVYAAISALREALAQPEQEVSCRFCHDKKGCWTWQCYGCGEIDDVQKPAPPTAQHPWQGLTPEDVKHLYPYGRSVWGKETFEAIEKALKDKNT